jgi:hypothetical protein
MELDGVGLISFIVVFILVLIYFTFGNAIMKLISGRQNDFEVDGDQRTKIRHEGGI